MIQATIADKIATPAMIANASPADPGVWCAVKESWVEVGRFKLPASVGVRSTTGDDPVSTPCDGDTGGDVPGDVAPNTASELVARDGEGDDVGENLQSKYHQMWR
jgi:hypothetical protein